MRAPRVFARSISSSTSTAAPSPITNPSRPASKGREAVAGSSLRVDMARMMANAPKQSGASGVSTPPASTTSASPVRMARHASPSAMAPEAQLIPLVLLIPVKPNSMATLQLAAPLNTASASMGSTPRTPLWTYEVNWFSPYATPPSALPISTPARSGSSAAGSSDASASASRDAASENCAYRSVRRARLRSM